MTLMFDGIDPTGVPGGAAIYAGYVDGAWPSYYALAAKYPSALHVSITVTAAYDARVLDVENGDATPADAPGWAARQRAAGEPYPVIYVNESTWDAVKAAFADQKVAAPLYWVASYVEDPATVPAVPAGAIALQYYDYGGYDASVVADHWPGLDPPPPVRAQSAQAAQPAPQEDPVQIEPLAIHPGEYAVAFAPDSTEMVLVADGYGQPAASLRIAMWAANNPTVMDAVVIGGVSGVHTIGHDLPAGCTGVTVRRLDGEQYPVGIAFR